MDHELLRRAYDDANELYCVFTKGILARHCSCAQAERFFIAEREGINCKSQLAQARCAEFMHLIRNQAKFALRTTGTKDLVHAKELKLQIGSLRGLQAALHTDSNLPVDTDVNTLLIMAQHQFDNFHALPLNLIIQHIAAFAVRSRKRIS
ncbi:hypothetical protein TI04_06795 [Achromatium sp. WMS2]|nr:hypothetical protein TI04_06795 [Achromatium sp. WMS2]